MGLPRMNPFLLLLLLLCSSLLPSPSTATEHLSKKFILTIKEERLEAFLSSRPALAEKAIEIRDRVKSHPIFLAEIPVDKLSFFRNLNFHKAIEENHPVYAESLYVQEVSDLWHLDTICKKDFSSSDGKYTYNYLGTGVDVYIFDTGINRDHEDFENRAFRYASYTSSSCADDCHGHGTHVAGTVGGKKYGVAKNVTLYDVQVLETNGVGDMFTISKALYDISSALKKTSIAVMSLGGARSETLKSAAKYAREKGLIVVASAGNNGANACLYSPADSEDVVTVAAHTPKGQRADFSNFGQCVEVYAPGTSIKSAYIGSTTATKTMSGTSMSAPVVGGVVATLLEQNTFLTFDLAVQILTNQVKTDFAETDAPAITSTAHSAPCSSRCSNQVITLSPFLSSLSFPEKGALALSEGTLSSWVYYSEDLSLDTFVLVLNELLDGDVIELNSTSNSNPLFITHGAEKGKTYQLTVKRNIASSSSAQLVTFLEMPLSCIAEQNCSSNGNCAAEVAGINATEICICFDNFYGDDCSHNLISFLFQAQTAIGSAFFLLFIFFSIIISYCQNRKKNRVNEMAPLLTSPSSDFE